MTDAERRELAIRCNRIDRAGGSVREYLKSLGFISPWGTWHRLQAEELGRKENQMTEGKGAEIMRKLMMEDKKKAVDVALGGGNPITFLKECGAGNPSAAWYYIKKTLKAVDPETYDRLTCRNEPDEKPDAAPEVELTIDSKELLDEAPSVSAVTKPVNYDGFELLAVKSPETGFRFESDPRYGMMTWRTISGDEVSMTAEEWHNLAVELPKALQIFGI